MERKPSEHRGKVTGVSGNLVYVHIEGRGATHDCASCALATACAASAGGDMTVPVKVSPGQALPAIGSTVRVRPLSHAQRTATLELLVLPLVVFLCAAAACTYFRLESGLVGVLSLAAAALSYLPIFLLHRGRKPVWTLVSDTYTLNT